VKEAAVPPALWAWPPRGRRPCWPCRAARRHQAPDPGGSFPCGPRACCRGQLPATRPPL